MSTDRNTTLGSVRITCGTAPWNNDAINRQTATAKTNANRNEGKQETPPASLGEMTPQERSLLVYLETRAVDYGGTVDARRMNSGDFLVVEKWRESGFVEFGRLSSDSANPAGGIVNWVVLSDGAWRLAHEERRARFARMRSRRTWETTEEARASGVRTKGVAV